MPAPKIDYYSLLADAVANLADQNNTERRRELYDRGRLLILARLREASPADPSVLDREMTSFRDACRRVEANFNSPVVPDNIRRPAEPVRRRKGRIWAAVATTIAALAIVAGGVYWQFRPRSETPAGFAALAEMYSLVNPALAAVPGAREDLIQTFTNIAEDESSDPRNANALLLLKAGKAADAEPLLKAVAEDRAKHADRNAGGAAAAYLNLALVAAVSVSGRDREYLAEAARLDSTNIETMMLNGWYLVQAGQLDAARAAFARVIAVAKTGSDDQALISAQLGMGAIQQQNGDLAAAFATYQNCQAVVERLAKSDPGNSDWPRRLSLSYVSLAFDYRKAQQPMKAREALSVGRSIVAPLVAKFPDDPQLKQALPWYDQQIAALSN
jgi:tetratricopeptide (TPR) repeat protein